MAKTIKINGKDVDIDEFGSLESIHKPGFSFEITLKNKDKTKILVFGVEGDAEEAEKMKGIKEQIVDYWSGNPPLN